MKLFYLIIIYFLIVESFQTNVSEKVICVFVNWASRPKISTVGNVNRRYFLRPEEIDVSICDIIKYAYALIDRKKLTLKPSLTSDIARSRELGNPTYKKIIRLKKKNPKLQILLSIGDELNDMETFKGIAMNNGNRGKFARRVSRYLRKYRFDGMDMDLKYPNKDDSYIEHFYKLLTELKKQFKKSKYYSNSKRKWIIDKKPLKLSALAQKLPPIDQFSLYQLKNICNNIFDHITLATYDYEGINSQKTGHNSPLYSTRTYSLNSSIEQWLNVGCEPQQLFISISLYGKTYDIKKPDENSSFSSTTQIPKIISKTKNLTSTTKITISSTIKSTEVTTTKSLTVTKNIDSQSSSFDKELVNDGAGNSKENLQNETKKLNESNSDMEGYIDPSRIIETFVNRNYLSKNLMKFLSETSVNDNVEESRKKNYLLKLFEIGRTDVHPRSLKLKNFKNFKTQFLLRIEQLKKYYRSVLSYVIQQVINHYKMNLMKTISSLSAMKNFFKTLPSFRNDSRELSPSYQSANLVSLTNEKLMNTQNNIKLTTVPIVPTRFTPTTIQPTLNQHQTMIFKQLLTSQIVNINMNNWKYVYDFLKTYPITNNKNFDLNLKGDKKLINNLNEYLRYHQLSSSTTLSSDHLHKRIRRNINLNNKNNHLYHYGLMLDYPTISRRTSKNIVSFAKLCNISKQSKDNVITLWDSKALVPVTLQKLNETTIRWITHENVMSLTEKIKQVVFKKLAGIQIWSLHEDDFKGTYCGRGPFSASRSIKLSLLNVVDAYKKHMKKTKEEKYMKEKMKNRITHNIVYEQKNKEKIILEKQRKSTILEKLDKIKSIFAKNKVKLKNVLEFIISTSNKKESITTTTSRRTTTTTNIAIGTTTTKPTVLSSESLLDSLLFETNHNYPTNFEQKNQNDDYFTIPVVEYFDAFDPIEVDAKLSTFLHPISNHDYLMNTSLLNEITENNPTITTTWNRENRWFWIKQIDKIRKKLQTNYD
ncbi:hypothetical protein SNEBB_010006 [Seison nebaliae]|nr:hypothetical protein SNEBB_010006 [Seison nebaliae]